MILLSILLLPLASMRQRPMCNSLRWHLMRFSIWSNSSNSAWMISWGLGAFLLIIFDITSSGHYSVDMYMGRPGALMDASCLRAGVAMVSHNCTLVWNPWKCAGWHCRSSMARAAYPRVSWSLAAWVIEKQPLNLVNVTPKYTLESTTSTCPLIGWRQLPCWWISVDVWKITALVFPRLAMRFFCGKSHLGHSYDIVSLHEVQRPRLCHQR